ncbi:uncharacterized protein LOC129597875 [Paramacrobiotus metropolitanus]|uniref:uncharacterized protein LOC129597875 n=1 Tax=Paramacrobiotus metropolitanus TaxID=2943436 RepID=UPI0024457F0E|nr:uncharacterized protein LOC129597875 [Paramacrobiotus metropolitanus]
MMPQLPLVLYLLSATLPITLGGGSDGTYGSGGATNGQMQLNTQQAVALDNGNHNSVAQSQGVIAGTTLNIGGNAGTSLQFDPTLIAKPAPVSGSNSVNADGSAMTGVLQSNQNSQSNSSDGQHHKVTSQSQITGNGTGMHMSNSASGSLYLLSTTPVYPTRFPCMGVTCNGYGCMVIENGYSCYCACPTTRYYYDSTYPRHHPLRRLKQRISAREDLRPRRTLRDIML